MPRVIRWIADLWLDDELPYTPLCHSCEALIESRNHGAIAKIEAKEILLIALHLAQLLGLKWPTKISDRVSRPIDHYSVALLGLLACAHLAIFVEETGWGLDKVRVRHLRLAVVLALQRRLVGELSSNGSGRPAAQRSSKERLDGKDLA